MILLEPLILLYTAPNSKFQLHPPYVFWEDEFGIIIRKFILYVALATNQAIWTKVIGNMEDYSINISVKNQISLMRRQKLPISTFPFISLWKLKVTISTRVLIRPGKTTFLEDNVLSEYAKFQPYPPYGFIE